MCTKNFKYILLLILSFFGCFMSFVLSYFFKLDAVTSTIIFDISIGIFCYFVYKEQFKDNKIKTKINFLYLGLFVFLVWFSTQIAAVWFYSTFGDSSFDAYSNELNGNYAVYLLLSLFVAPIIEELLMRGIVFNIIKKHSLILAYIISSLVFAVMHGTLIHLYVGFIVGLFFAIVYQTTGKLKYNIICHILYNFLSIFCSSIFVLPLFINIWFVIALNAFCVVFLLYKSNIHHLIIKQA